MMLRRLSILLALAGLVAGCGSSSNGSSTSSTQQRGRGFASDPKVVACLKKQGVTLPTRRGRPPGANGQRPGGAGSAQFQKLRAALQKCGVTPPQPGQGGPGGGAPPTTSAS